MIQCGKGTKSLNYLDGMYSDSSLTTSFSSNYVRDPPLDGIYITS